MRMSLSRLTPRQVLLIALGVLALAWAYTLISYRMGDGPILSVRENHELLLGMGQLYELPIKRGPLKVSGDRSLELVRVGDNSKVSRFWVLGKGSGKTDIEFRENPRSDIPLKISVAVSDPDRISQRKRDGIISRMMTRERSKGITTKAIRIFANQKKTVVLPFQLGPILLANPGIVYFNRKGMSQTVSNVEIAGLSPGLTNLYFMDVSGRPVYMLVVEVVSAASRDAASKASIGLLPAPKPRFYDDFYGEKVPVY